MFSLWIDFETLFLYLFLGSDLLDVDFIYGLVFLHRQLMYCALHASMIEVTANNNDAIYHFLSFVQCLYQAHCFRTVPSCLWSL